MASINNSWFSQRLKADETGDALDEFVDRLNAEAEKRSTGYMGKAYDGDITRFFHFAQGKQATRNDYRATRGGFRDAALKIDGVMTPIEIKRGAGDLSRRVESKEAGIDMFAKMTGLCVWSYDPPRTDANPLVMRWCDLMIALDGYKKGRAMFFKYNKNTGVFGVQEVTTKNDRKRAKVAFLDEVCARGYSLRALGYSRTLSAWNAKATIDDYLDALNCL